MTANSEFCNKHQRAKDAIPADFIRAGKVIYNCPECAAEKRKEDEEAEKEAEARRRQAVINRKIENSLIAPRFKGKTIEGYLATTAGQKEAVEACRRFLDRFSESPGMIFVGGPGTGKNHLAAAVAFEVINQGQTALFVELSKMIRQVKESWGKDSTQKESDILKSFSLPDLLIIDELGVQFESKTEKLYLTEIINDRYAYLKPTILIGNLTKKELVDLLGDRVVDRFRDGGSLIIFDWASFRGRK